jgi:hypothetical protein
LTEQGKRTFIPLWSGRVGNSKYLTSGLVYEKEHDRFRCPEGKYLNPNPANYENHKRYVSSSADCQVCPQSSTCPARTRGSSPQRFFLRSLDQDLFEEVLTRIRDPVFRQKLSERMWKIEGLFAEAKQNHGLSRARNRGRAKVQIQAYLSATAQDLKRLVKAFLWWLVVWLSHGRNNLTQLAQPTNMRTFSTRPTVFWNFCRWALLPTANTRRSPPPNPAPRATDGVFLCSAFFTGGMLMSPDNGRIEPRMFQVLPRRRALRGF